MLQCAVIKRSSDIKACIYCFNVNMRAYVISDRQRTLARSNSWNKSPINRSSNILRHRVISAALVMYWFFENKLCLELIMTPRKGQRIEKCHRKNTLVPLVWVYLLLHWSLQKFCRNSISFFAKFYLSQTDLNLIMHGIRLFFTRKAPMPWK